MKQCPACRNSISEFVTICPNCGLDLNRGSMEGFLSIQRRAKVSRKIVINFLILLMIGLLYSPLKRYFLENIMRLNMYALSDISTYINFYNEISRRVTLCDIVIWSIAIGFSVINIIRYKLLSNNTGAILIIIVCDLIIAALPYYFYYLSNSYMVQFEFLEDWYYSRETIIKEVLKFLIWVCITVEGYCINKSSKIY